MVWRRPARPYPADEGVSARMLDMPIETPYPRRSGPARLRERHTAGDPSCRECTPRRACDEHKDFHALVDPGRTVA